SDQIFDDFESAIFQNHPLGYNILGKQEVVKSFTSNSLRKFYERYYLPDNAVFSYIGSASPERFIKLLQQYFENWTGNAEVVNNHQPDPLKFFDIKKNEDTYQAHLMLGTRGFG